jgi:hypothetical protein
MRGRRDLQVLVAWMRSDRVGQWPARTIQAREATSWDCEMPTTRPDQRDNHMNSCTVQVPWHHLPVPTLVAFTSSTHSLNLSCVDLDSSAFTGPVPLAPVVEFLVLP